MGEKVKINNHIVNAVLLDDAPTSVTSDPIYVGGMEKLSFWINVVKANAPTNVIFTVEGSPDNKVTWLSYDKLLDGSGTDAPVGSITYTASTEDVCSMSPEDVVDWIRVIFTATGTTASATFTCDCWVVGK